MKNAINTECEEHSYKEAEKQRIEEFREAAGHVFSANMIKEMKDMGFFLCPASLGHHGDHIGGLYDHSMAVLRALKQLTTCLDLSWQRKKSPILIAVFHDWAKLQDYIQIGTGREIQYIHNTHKTLHGHGNISVIMALQFLQNHISAQPRKRSPASDITWEHLSKTGTSGAGTQMPSKHSPMCSGRTRRT